MSRSSHVPHAGHCQMRTCSGLGPSLTPHTEQTCEVGSNRPMRWNSRPYSRALYSSMARTPTIRHRGRTWPGGCGRVPSTARSSTATAWFSRISAVDSWWWNSRRASATRACALATLIRALPRFLVPFCLRDRSPLALLEFLLGPAQEPRGGDLPAVGQDREVGRARGRSRSPVLGRGQRRSGSALHDEAERRYRPAASLITVTVDGSDGSARDQRTGTSPIFGRRSFPPGVIREPGVAR